MSGFVLESHSTYCSLEFTDALLEMTWEQIENATSRAIELIRDSHQANVLILAPSLRSLPEGLLACLLRIWKSLNIKARHFIFVTASEAVKEGLSAAGLLQYWKVMDSRDAALRFLHLADTREFDMIGPGLPGAVVASSAETEDPLRPGAEPCQFEQSRRYCAILCSPSLERLPWEDLDAAMSGAISRFDLADSPNLMIDLSKLAHINSGVVACLVRCWKSAQKKGGQFSVISPNENVTLILKTSGLSKVWSITEDREEAAYALGVSESAIAQRRERSLLLAVSLSGSVVAALAMTSMFLKRDSLWGINSQLTALLLSSASVSTGLLAMIRENGLRRKLSIGSVLISLVVLSTLWFRENPISFRKQIPDYKFQRENDDPPENAEDLKAGSLQKD